MKTGSKSPLLPAIIKERTTEKLQTGKKVKPKHVEPSKPAQLKIWREDADDVDSPRRHPRDRKHGVWVPDQTAHDLRTVRRIRVRFHGCRYADQEHPLRVGR